MNDELSRSFLCSAVDAMSHGVAITDVHGTVLYANRAWEEFARRSHAAHAPVSNIADYLDACCINAGQARPAAGSFAKGVRQLRSAAVSYYTMDFPCRMSGQNRWIQWHLTLFSEGGQQYVMVLHEDITRQRKAEQRHAEYATLLNSTLAAMESLIVVIDQDLRIVLSNWKDHQWVPESERNRRPLCYRVLKHYEAPCADCPPARSLADGRPRRYEARNPVDGSYKDVSVIPICREDGSVQYVLENVRDVTERKQTEAALRKSEEKYRSILASMEEGYYETDLAGNVVFCNDAMADILGYGRDEMAGLNYKQTMREDVAAVVFRTFNQVYRTGKSFRIFKWDLLRKDDSAVSVEVSVSLRRDGDGKVIGFQGIARDITERKRAEQEREQLHAQLRHAQKMEAIGTLAAGIAHDFNNILSAVIGYTELSLDELPEGTRLHQNLSQVLAAGNRARDLVRQILTLGRREAQGFAPAPVTSLVKEALKMLRSTFPVSIDFRESLCSEPLIVNIDPTQLHQVIVNLATNARHAMPDETGVLEVSVEPVVIDPAMAGRYPDLRPGDYARIRFSDNGCGIAGEHLDRIFEPYFTTKEKDIGTGLGLSMVHSIVQNHGGMITVDSAPGRGTTFCVYLPLAGQNCGESVVSGESVAPLPGGRERVLLVDDEIPIVEVQKQVLNRLGYRVTSYTGSLEALQAFLADPYGFDILITDMTMPEMTGERLAQKVRDLRPDMPVILITGYSEKFRAHRDHPAIDALLIKPVDKAEMANTLRNLLDVVYKKDCPDQVVARPVRLTGIDHAAPDLHVFSAQGHGHQNNKT